MKLPKIAIFAFLLLSFIVVHEIKSNTSTKIYYNNNYFSKTIKKNNYDSFKLSYSYAGLGSNMGSMQPVFKVVGKNYIYTLEQNSYYDKPNLKPQFISKGTLRTSSIDSILNLVRDIKDTLVYKTDIHIWSGGIDNLSVNYGKINVTFELHNKYDKTAQKIVAILNTYIPDEKNKLWIFPK